MVDRHSAEPRQSQSTAPADRAARKSQAAIAIGPVGAIDTATLFAGSTEVRLAHRGQEYRLRITRQGKLILTK